MAFYTVVASSDSDEAIQLPIVVIPGWCGSTRPQMRNCASGNLEIPGSMRSLTAIALEPLTGSTPDRFAAYVKTEVARWAVIVRNSGAELE
jgi:hypothetical protein